MVPGASSFQGSTMADNFNRERAATMLAEAAIFGDRRAVERTGLTLRSLQNYRRRLATDARLSLLFAEKRKLLSSRWADDLIPAIRGAVDFLHRACEQADPSNPRAIRAVTGSLKILADVATAERLLDARFPDAPRAHAAPDRAVASGNGDARVH